MLSLYTLINYTITCDNDVLDADMSACVRLCLSVQRGELDGIGVLLRLRTQPDCCVCVCACVSACV